MIIDATYFVANLNIPNSGDTAISQTITWFINKYEPEFLEKLMGYPLYKAFQAGLAAEPATERFTDILNGKEYTNLNGRLVKWKGLKETTPQKFSVIACYVYYWYYRNASTQTTGTGESRPKTDNTDNVSPRQKMISALNEVYYTTKAFIEFLEANQAIYPEWSLSDKVETLSKIRFANPIF
ncbi:MAG: hypothetical protein V4450_07430 [Bacteroidota bacterium]